MRRMHDDEDDGWPELNRTNELQHGLRKLNDGQLYLHKHKESSRIKQRPGDGQGPAAAEGGRPERYVGTGGAVGKCPMKGMRRGGRSAKSSGMGLGVRVGTVGDGSVRVGTATERSTPGNGRGTWCGMNRRQTRQIRECNPIHFVPLHCQTPEEGNLSK